MGKEVIQQKCEKNSILKISIIVPVFNTKKFVHKCLDSILQQSLSNFELILVDDASTDGSEDILKEYAARDNRITLIKHEQNMGLFQARLTGVEASNGQYIAFVDSDDTVSIDWFRLLIKEAETSGSDIVMGNTICEDENNWKYIFNITASLSQNHPRLLNEEVFENFMQNEGMCFSWHTVWNKIYSRDLWDQSLPFFKKITEHFIMTEDISFSTVLSFHAKSMSIIPADGYFYYRHADASTGKITSLAKMTKTIKDLMLSFTFIKDFLVSVGVYEQYENSYMSWKNRYFRWWSFTLKNFEDDSDRAGVKQLKSDFLNFFDKKNFEAAKTDDNALGALKSSWNGDKEYIKKCICDTKTEVVSFDIFDTLLLRPFLEPTDLFEMMQSLFMDLTHLNISFRTIRTLSENACRRITFALHPKWQDVTLDEIYEVMANEYSIPLHIAEQLKKREILLETQYLSPRMLGVELLELAQEMKKTVVLTSDMYLSQKVVEDILLKNNIIGYKRLYLSSSLRMLKGTKKLFRYMLDDLGITQCDTVIHIGDNWHADNLAARDLGIKTFFLPKAKDILFNTLGDKYTGDIIANSVFNSNSVVDCFSPIKQLPVRCCFAISANQAFDNPFINVDNKSDFNGNPYFVGLIALGPHLLNLCNWLLNNGIQKGYKTIHFLARDGFLPKQVYDVLAQSYPNAPKSNYIYGSRKSLLPISFRCKEDFYSLVDCVNFNAHTPKSILKMLQHILAEMSEAKETSYKKLGFMMEERFASQEELLIFIKAMLKISYDKGQMNQARSLAQQYFTNQIGPHDAVFDLGYSGKLHSYIVDLLGFSIPAYYVHSNGEDTQRVARQSGFDVYTYYNFTPSMSGVVNEYFLSDYASSCVGYCQAVDGNSAPLFEPKEVLYSEQFIISEIHRGCIDFCRAFKQPFADVLPQFLASSIEPSLVYEKFLCHPKEMEKHMMMFTYMEDELYGGISKQALSRHWSWQIESKQLAIPTPAILAPATPLSIAGNAAKDIICFDTELSDLYRDGLFMALYRKLNKWFPKGTRRRENMKKFIGIFIK